ncbi:MAG: glycosyltransferase family 4 protein [Candidatus Wallbacteria bacterium]|nr:glycosyltransferase family 4 protein [Candidatus Wallbacteria bacterium]
MKIGILTMYYPPEVGAPQRRLSELADFFVKNGHSVTVFTTFPNYPDGRLKGKYDQILFKNEINGIRIIRSYSHFRTDPGIFDRLASHLSFMLSSSIALVFSPQLDLLIVESPPLFLGLTGVFARIFKKSRMVFHVSDLWPDSIRELGALKNESCLKMLEWIEEFIYHRSAAIVAVTKGIHRNLKRRGFKRLAFIPNGVDLDRITVRADKCSLTLDRFGLTSTDFIALYAGTFGLAHPLELIIEAASRLEFKLPDLKFLLVGGGARFEEIRALAFKLSNVIVVPPVPMEEMDGLLSVADTLVLALKDLPLFSGALPSKIYEANGAGKPVLALLDGETRSYFEKSGGGEALGFGRADQLAGRLHYYYHHREELAVMGRKGRAYVEQKYSREALGRRYLRLFERIMKKRHQ